MKRCMSYVVVVLLVFAFALGVSAAERIKIGITQIVEHPALDAARKGFIDQMAELGYVEGKNVEYDVQSAQGDMSIAQTIAQKFVTDGVDMILALATPSAQAAANVTDTIPILITAVTDPVAAGLVDSIDVPGGNVTGTSDLTPVAKQLELIQRIKPSVKRIGVVYNAGEINSVVQVDLAKQIAKDMGISIIDAPAANSGGVFQAAQSLVGRVDAIYVPTDNTVASSIESVIMVAESAGLPLVVGEEGMVRRGSLGTVGIDYYQLGRQTARMAVEVLNGASPAAMPIQYLDSDALIINLQAAKAMGIQVPDDVIADAVIVIE